MDKLFGKEVEFVTHTGEFREGVVVSQPDDDVVVRDTEGKFWKGKREKVILKFGVNNSVASEESSGHEM